MEATNVEERIEQYHLAKSSTDFPRVTINSAETAYNYIKQFYGTDIEIYESFFVLLLNQAAQTVGYAKISQGGVAATVVDVKIILYYAVNCLAQSVIIAHNHPSGVLKPSEQDLKITKRIKDALDIMDIKLKDHIILGEKCYYSFADEGTL